MKNLREQLEKLNGYTFSEDEWKRFFTQNLSNANDGIVEKTRLIQEDNVQVLKRDDGSSKNITLIDKKNIHNNSVQVINQYVENGGNFDNRYDVTILVNGFPLVHIELKRRGVALKEAFNQIERYQRDSFWAASGLYEYVQLFVISNGTRTKYYSNTTRISAIKERDGKKKVQKTSSSFEFTSFWADANNKVIPDLVDFTKTFFQKHTLLNIITKYCVLTSENLLLVMRPYQIVATERILNRIEIATNYKKMGSTDAGGYIWHTTGSGKTLTSFKTAQLVSRLPYVDKVLFVVDRKDLDYQTMKEYDRFERGAADGNKTSKILQRQLEDRDAKGNPHEYKIIVTTIQKLDKGYEERIAELIQKYPLGTDILGESAKKDFIVSFGNILRLRNILSTFDNFAGNEILSPIDFQDYTGIYNDLYIEFRPQAHAENIDDDIVFEMELVKQIEVNIDYILMLVAKYHKSNCEDKEVLIAIDRAIKSSIELRSKKELIEGFIATINTQTDVNSDWRKFVLQQKETDLTALIAEEKLKEEETRKYIDNAFRDGGIKTTGTDIDKLMPPVSRFGGGNRANKKQGIIDKLMAFFEKYFGIV